ncbi:MAG TPA: hypothetical protein VHF22_11270 [Planctomycetota bacterium]|nr:hypothetical protein [Planctomycetota bacterium]
MLGGRAIRERLPGERAPDPCDFGCERDGPCFVEAGFFDVEAASIAETWALCGGRDRRCWPRGGGLEAQESGLVAVFASIDAMVAEADARDAARAAARVNATKVR